MEWHAKMMMDNDGISVRSAVYLSYWLLPTSRDEYNYKTISSWWKWICDDIFLTMSQRTVRTNYTEPKWLPVRWVVRETCSPKQSSYCILFVKFLPAETMYAHAWSKYTIECPETKPTIYGNAFTQIIHTHLKLYLSAPLSILSGGKMIPRLLYVCLANKQLNVRVSYISYPTDAKRWGTQKMRK